VRTENADILSKKSQTFEIFFKPSSKQLLTEELELELELGAKENRARDLCEFVKLWKKKRAFKLEWVCGWLLGHQRLLAIFPSSKILLSFNLNKISFNPPDISFRSLPFGNNSPKFVHFSLLK